MASAPGYHTIAVGVDFSPASRVAFRHAVALARGLGARLVAVHTVPRLKPSVPFSRENRRVVAALQQEAVEEARRALERLGKEAGDVKLSTVVARGVPSEQILTHARRRNADLIVLGKRGQSLAESLLIGSTAERVARRATVPVVIVPSGED